MKANRRLFLASALMLCFMQFGNPALANESATQPLDTVNETGDTEKQAEFGIETDVNVIGFCFDAHMFSMGAEDDGIRWSFVLGRPC